MGGCCQGVAMLLLMCSEQVLVSYAIVKVLLVFSAGTRVFWVVARVLL